MLKVKLATALIGISSIHLLKTFIEIGTPGTTEQTVLWQVVVHLTFVVSALLLAWTDRISSVTAVETRTKGALGQPNHLAGSGRPSVLRRCKGRAQFDFLGLVLTHGLWNASC